MHLTLRRYQSFTFIYLFFTGFIPAQSLQVTDYYGKAVNNDTLHVIFHPNANHGWTELNRFFQLKNISNKSIIIIAKKTEYNIQSDEYHSICFGGSCFDSSTFVAPFKVTLLPGIIDSSFSGHFRFDDLLHKPGICKVAYTFYDENNPADSSIVYVNYNTLQKAGMQNQRINYQTIKAWPNPVSATLFLNLTCIQAETCQNLNLHVFDALGKHIKTQAVNTNDDFITIDFTDFKEGLYFVSLKRNNILIGRIKIIVNHAAIH